MPTSIYSISKHLEDIYSVLGLLGLGWAQNESHPLPALVKPKSGERDMCAHKCQVLSADLSYCHCVNQAGAGTEPGLHRCPLAEVTAPLYPLSCSSVLFYHPPVFDIWALPFHSNPSWCG